MTTYRFEDIDGQLTDERTTDLQEAHELAQLREYAIVTLQGSRRRPVRHGEYREGPDARYPEARR